MISYQTILLQFDEKGEKTGWTYIVISADQAQQLKPGNKQSFRVKGRLDAMPIKGVALIPMGEGDFIMAVNGDMRKGLRKNSGAMVQVNIEIDPDVELVIPNDLHECFDFEPDALAFFNSLPMGHRRYFVTWINSAKTEATRSTRIANTINAMLNKWRYNDMMRAIKNIKE